MIEIHSEQLFTKAIWNERNKTANDTTAWWWWYDDKMKIDTFNRPKNDNFRFLYIVCCLVFRPDIATDHRRRKRRRKKSQKRIYDCYKCWIAHSSTYFGIKFVPNENFSVLFSLWLCCRCRYSRCCWDVWVSDEISSYSYALWLLLVHFFASIC